MKNKYIKLFYILLLFPLYAYSSVYFSSYTKGLYEVLSITHENGYHQIELDFPKEFSEKLNKRSGKFNSGNYLNIDGVKGLVVDTKSEDRFYVSIRIPSGIYESSTLHALKPGEKVSIGMLSLNPNKYLIQEGPVDKVKLIEVSVAPGHEYTIELTFSASLSQADLIRNSMWVGLNGSGFYIQEYKVEADQVVFKIHAGRNTRNLSVFGNTAVVGQEFNLAPKVQDPSLEPK
jgi:hypothetical protein